MKVVTYNIQYELGKDNRYDLARIGREIEDADISALQEWSAIGGARSASTPLPSWVHSFPSITGSIGAGSLAQ